MDRLFGFPEVVLTAFKFLVDDFSFRCVNKDVTFVRFESRFAFVNIYHGRVCHELGVEIGELSRAEGLPENPFTIGEIFYLVDPRQSASYRPYQVHTPDLVKKFVGELAHLVKKYATPALIGDHNFFQRLSEIRSQRSDEYLREVHLGDVRNEAETAWRQKDYSRVIEIYNSIIKDLTPLETKRLAYAKKKKCLS